MEKSMYMSAAEVGAVFGYKEGYGYKIIRQLNHELKEKGYLIVKGKINRKFFEEHFYGLSNPNPVLDGA